MKLRIKAFPLAYFVFILTVALAQSSGVSAQSGRTTRPGEKTAETKIVRNENTAQKNDCAAETKTFRYVAPLAVREFIKALDKLGACGYRLENVTHVPDEKIAKGYYEREEFGSLKLAALVRLDRGRFEYEALQIEKTADLALRLNELARGNFAMREIIPYDATYERVQTGDDPTVFDETSTAYIRQIHNLILFERSSDAAPMRRGEFRVIKAGVGAGKNPSEKMQALLDEALRENFRPVESFLSSGFGRDKILDSYNGIILEKTGAAQTAEIRFVRALLPGSFRDRVKELAGEGFRAENFQSNHGLMTKSETASRLAEYLWLNAISKTFAADLARLSGTGVRYVGAVGGGHALIESQLVFERTSEEKFEYRIVRLEEKTGQTFTSGASTDFPARLKELTGQGFVVRELFNNGEISILLEKKL